jgi:hypothetical protein
MNEPKREAEEKVMRSGRREIGREKKFIDLEARGVFLCVFSGPIVRSPIFGGAKEEGERETCPSCRVG